MQHIRGGKEIGNITAQNWYSFNYQAAQPIAYNQTILPGDSFISNCVWDTTGACPPSMHTHAYRQGS